MKKKFTVFKKIILTLVLVIALIVGFGFFTAKKLPPEARYLINHIENEKIMNDMTNDPEKYKKQPCFEIEFNKEKYCFDKSRVYFEKKYIDSETREDESAVIYFFPKALAVFPSENREVRFDVKVDRYHRDDINEPEYFLRSAIQDDSKDQKIFRELINENKNAKFIEITNILKKDWLHGGKKYFIIKFDDRVVMNLVSTSNKYFKFIGQTTFQPPLKKIYFEFQIVSNQATHQEFLQTALEIAQEFDQFLNDSKVSNQILSNSNTK